MSVNAVAFLPMFYQVLLWSLFGIKGFLSRFETV
jgi:hypothetical protein